MGIERVDLPGTYISTIPELKPVIARWMTEHVHNHATDAADARDLLGVLGLPGGVIRANVTTLACGHPSTEAYRSAGTRGVLCRACRSEYEVHRRPRTPETFNPPKATTCDARRGTEAGYKRHRRAGEAPCLECVEGSTAARRGRGPRD